MGAPFVYAPFNTLDGVYTPELQVSWPLQAGLSVDHYEVYVDGATVPAGSVNNNSWTMAAANGLKPGSTHSFQVAYVTTGGERSPMSETTAGSTWGGLNWDGIPFEWMTAHFGANVSSWPRASAVVAPQAPALLDIFLSGAAPTDPATWLKTRIDSTSQGLFLSWNCRPGLIYQVQTSTNLSTWTDVGAPRFAAGAQDSIFVGNGSSSYYRVLRLR
jgi:hypothetical protein